MQRSIGQIGRQWLTVVAVLIAIAANGLSNVYPPAGKNIGEVSKTTLGGVLITPAGYAFAIWGLIYLGLIAYSFYQVLPAQRSNPRLTKVSWALIGACGLQIAWVYAFLTFHFWGSVVLMGGILACLLFAYVQTRSLSPTRQTRWLVQAPISVYCGWITVATVVNVAGAIYALRIPSAEIAAFSGVIGATTADVILTGIMIGVSAGIAAFMALKYNDVAYPAVIVWALSAIAIRQAGDLPALAITSGCLAVGLSGLILIRRTN